MAKNCLLQCPPMNGISFHAFPRNLQQRASWERAIANILDVKTPLKIPNTAYLCGRHFNWMDYMLEASPRRILREDAIPKANPNACREERHTIEFDIDRNGFYREFHYKRHHIEEHIFIPRLR